MKGGESMKTVAFMTYRGVDGYATGWHERDGRKALVIWSPSYRLDSELERCLPELDHIVIYVGESCMEEAIEVARRVKGSATFVGCRCGMDSKFLLLQQAGFALEQTLVSECWGTETMGKLVDSFLSSGSWADLL
jgi:hypothetical protein